jgi:hypothetical protein
MEIIKALLIAGAARSEYLKYEVQYIFDITKKDVDST